MLNAVESLITMSRCIRWKYVSQEHGFSFRLQYLQLPWNENDAIEISNATDDFCREFEQIEFIIIPDRYLDDEEIIQTLHVRHDAHLRKNRIAFVFSSTDLNHLLSANAISTEILKKIYKISTIRHGFITEERDENKPLILELAKQCVATESEVLSKITIRSCYSAGDLDEGLMDVEHRVLLGHMGDKIDIDEDGQRRTRAFLYGDIEFPRTSAYSMFKNETIRTQTVSVQEAKLLNPLSPNVLYDFRKSLDLHPELKKLHVKGYYGRVNPVPERLPNRLGIWFCRDRPPALTYPKAVCLLGSLT